MSKCIVYCLFEELKPNVIRYVGQTKQKIQTRLKQHIDSSKKHKKLSRSEAWIASVYRLGGIVGIKTIDSNATWDVTEVQLILKYRNDGHPLMNVLDGGKDRLKDFKRRKNKQRRKSISKQNKNNLNYKATCITGISLSQGLKNG